MRFHYHLIGMAGLLAVCPAQAATQPAIVRQALDTSTEITLPPEAAARAKAAPETIRAGRNSGSVQGLKVIRQFPMVQLGKNPEITLGKTRFSMAPVFANPSALPNIAKRLRTTPQLVTVVAEDIAVTEVDRGSRGRGLQVWQFLSYQIKPGVCSNAGRRGALAKDGVGCSNRLSNQARAAAFANAKDPHYVADPAQRAKALADANVKVAQANAAIAIDIAKIRTALSSAEGRAHFDDERGPGEGARLSALTDDQLTEEMINSGLTKIEQVLFIPSSEATAMRKPPATLQLADPKPEPVDVDRALEPRVFLTGFTLGREFKWQQRVEKTIDFCPWPVDCPTTYYAEVYAGFSYGLGLRFPIKLSGTYHHHQDGQAQSASVTTKFAPIDGSVEDYTASGLPGEKLFKAKELVAEFTAYAGAGYNLPFYPSVNLPVIPFGDDLTRKFDVPFTNGQFRPPAPGEFALKPLEVVFRDIDVLGGRANFKIVAAKVFPAIRAKLTSESLTFALHDFYKKADADVVLSYPGAVTDLAINPKDNSSKFSISDPKYNLSFLVTPGLVGNLSVYIGVWSDDWDFPVWFPQLALKIPEAGVVFTCHDQTTCARTYHYSAKFAKAEDDNRSLFERDVAEWAENLKSDWVPQCPDYECESKVKLTASDVEAIAWNKFKNGSATKMSDITSVLEDARNKVIVAWNKGFVSKWHPQCADLDCKIAVSSINLDTRNKLVNRYEGNPTTSMDEIALVLGEAIEKAQAAVAQSKQRQKLVEQQKIEQQHKSYMFLAQALWSSKCMDQLCRTNVGALSGKMLAELIAQSKQNSDASAGEIQASVGKLYIPKFQAEIDASKARVGRSATGTVSPSTPAITNGRTATPTPEPPTIYQGRVPVAAPEPTPAPPPVSQGRSGFPNFTFPTLAAPRPAPAVQKSTICRFTSGPRAGQDQDYAPMAPIPVGSNCQDGRGSVGSVVVP
jgi:hypothetical protein